MLRRIAVESQLQSESLASRLRGMLRQESSPGQPQSQGPVVNVGPNERQWSLAAGAALALLGLSRAHRLSGITMMGVGAALIHRGWTGNCKVSEWLGRTGRQVHDGSTEGKRTPQKLNEQGIGVEHAITIDKPASELYAFWRNFENLPRFMNELREVKVVDDRRSRWKATGPMGATVEWEAQIINEEPEKLIAWKSVGGDIDIAGTVRFEPATNGEGTVVRVHMRYLPPAGKVGDWIAKLFGNDPEQQTVTSLRQFKQLMETGELVSNANGQPRGQC
jgi:uncharacterized membrane protein